MRPNLLIALVVIACAAPLSAVAAPRGLTLESVNAAKFAKPGAKASQAMNIKAQILLDRASFSPGAIDGRHGENFVNALRAFQERNGLTASGELDAPTWKQVDPGRRPGVGRIHDQPPGCRRAVRRGGSRRATRRRRSFKRLDYTGPAELLAERFHMDEDLLEQLNRGKSFDEAGTVIVVADVNVKPVALNTKVGKLEVDKTREVGARAGAGRKADRALSGLDRQRGKARAIRNAQGRARRAGPDLHLQSGLQVQGRESESRVEDRAPVRTIRSARCGSR